MAWRKIEEGAGHRQARKAVLQVVGRMNPGGVETWLLHVLRRMDPARFRMDFLVFEDGAYAGEVRSAGGRLVRCANPQRHPLGFLRDLSRILREDGPYDAVHCHMNHFSGLVLRAAHRAGVPARISQSHIDTSRVDGAARGVRQGYLALSRMLIDRHATHLLAVSDEAGRSLYGPRYRDDLRFRRFACALDFERFAQVPDKAALRRALGLPASAIVVGNVGRLAPQKNQAFLLEVLAAAAREEPSLRAVIVGDGPLRGPLIAKARGLGLEDRVMFMGP
ncbi:MAG TPA: glycosyltransferase, partial [Vulgatibacter sp.]